MDWNFIACMGFFAALSGVDVYFNWRREQRRKQFEAAHKDMLLAMMEHHMTGRLPTPEEMAERRQKGESNGSS